ncbi:MAG: TIGR04283 family arsenosugar biosynthesis glycosyltransferase [Acidobacteria bacterium]|nr:TIGR04283 family arsenosugar biosynthesis glycosyltransferase [Acidobacteriota bacterium]MBI3427645.1 TIGR04283 family arsenosugar biosynthesis glycosyltransferase [Acidobacteriota bacterium]
MCLSIIIPTLNEAAIIRAAAAALAPWRDQIEIIIVDGGSTDETVARAQGCGLSVLTAPRGRGTQMNAGAQVARGDILLFLHADTRLPDEAPALIATALADPAVNGGHFSLQFDGGTRAAQWLTWLYPCLRLGGMCYGDSAIFARRAVFERLGGYRDMPLFEDVDLFKRLKRAGRFVHLPARATTSSRRFEGRFARTFALWSCLQVLYWLGAPPQRLAQLYRVAR